MSQKKSTIILHTHNCWEQAICDATAEVERLKKRIAALRQAIRSFEYMRDSGEPWPGTSESENGLIGQEGHLGQSQKDLKYEKQKQQS